MKLTRLIVLAIFVVLSYSCKPQFSVRSASWYSWTGGQPGVGGVKYRFVLDNQKKKPFQLEQVKIDGKEYTDSEVSANADSIAIVVSENIQRAEPTVGNPNPKQERIRSQSPQSAQLKGCSQNKAVLLEVKDFTKTNSRSFQ